MRLRQCSNCSNVTARAVAVGGLELRERRLIELDWVHQGLLRHSAAVKRTAKEGEPNGRNDGEERDGAGGLVGAPPRSWRRQVRRRATSATLLGEAEAASSQPAAAGRTTGAAGTGAQRHGGSVVGMAGSGFVGRGGGAQGAHRRRPRRRDCAAEG